jgi:mono/diheme cytochrome c family protein
MPARRPVERSVALCARAGFIAILLASTVLRAAPGDLPRQLGLRSGAAIYAAACVACHGAHGEGTPESIAGFTRPETFPHFDTCDETTPESTRDWKAVIRDGGPARGFSPIMPAFGDALSSAEIDAVLVQLRSFCSEPGWAVGELNVPRALFTEKAFPESESVLTTSVNTRGAAGIDGEFAYERILSRRDQLEVAVPFSRLHEDGERATGLGDVAVGVKHVLFADLAQGSPLPLYLRTGSILALQGEVVLPTGDAARGLGTGQTVIGVFAAYDRLLPARTFLQLQAGADLPVHASDAVPRAAFLRAAFGRSFSGADGLARLWSPMLEVVGNRDLIAGARTEWDVVPEFQVTLSQRQHVRLAFGYRMPLNDAANRPRQFTFYFLWDWFDGGLLEGW